MDHRMAVGAQWYEIFDRVNLVPTLDAANRDDMMNMDEPASELAILFLKIDIAAFAPFAMPLDAFGPRFTVPLKDIYEPCDGSTLPQVSLILL